MGQQEPHETQQGEVQSPVPGEEQPQAPTRAGGHPAGKQLGRKGSCWTPSWTWASTVSLQQGRQMVPWAALHQLLLEVGEKWYFPFALLSWDPTWSILFSSGLSNTRAVWTYWRESSKKSRRQWRVDHLCHEKRLGGLGLFSLGQRRLRGSYQCMENPEGRVQGGGARLCSVVPSDRATGNGHKLKLWRFPWDTRKHFLAERVTEHWHRLPKDVISVFKGIQKLFWTIALRGPSWAGGLDKMTSRGSFQPQPFCNSVILVFD